ncbi:MAG: GH3 auxin-responsive promoter family protein [Elainellaceae cyanobacterium]
MVNLLFPVLHAYAGAVKASFVEKTRQPLITQERYLWQLLQLQQATQLGQAFGLHEIKTIDQFRQQVPVWSYSDYEPYSERVAQGEPNVLNPEPVVYINLTSGTTGKQKKVPVTRRFQRSLGRANVTSFGFFMEALRTYSVERSVPLKFGPMVSTNSVCVQGQTSGGIDYGPVTVGSYRMSRFLCSQFFAQPFTAMEVADSASRHYVCLLFGLCHPHTRGMSANFPMLILRTCHYLDKYAEELIHDINSGTIAPWLKLEPELRTRLERQHRALPSRARQLREVLRSAGRLTPQLAWPKLSLVATAKGGTSNFYLQRFPEYFGDLPVYGGVYGTAEGTFSVYHDLESEGGILAIESGFYEFIPPDQWEAEHPQTLLPTEVKVGEYYRMLVTTYSGFYRYDIGDVVEVIGFYEQTPIIVFRHRRGGLLSSTTEKTTEFHVTQTMQMLQQEFNLSLEDFCITLSEQEFPAHYLINIELASGQTLLDPNQFLQRFDYWLGEFNHPYATVRSDQVPPPRLRILAEGSFVKVRQRQLRRGTSDSQLKVPHLSEDRCFLEGLQVLQEVQLPADLQRSLSE